MQAGRSGTLDVENAVEIGMEKTAVEGGEARRKTELTGISVLERRTAHRG